MELEQILSLFHQLTLVPVRHFHGDALSAAYGAEIYSEPYDQDVIDQLLNGGEAFCYQVTPEALLYGMLRLNAAESYLILGPVCRERDLHQTVSQLASGFRCEVSSKLWDYCRRLTICSLHSFLAQIQTVYNALHRDGYCDKQTLSHLFSSHVPQSQSLRKEIEEFHNRTIEQQAVSYIEHGKVDELRELLKFQMQGAEMPEYYNLSMIRSFQNIFIVSTALCSRAAIRGGMDFDAAIESSDLYIERVERMLSAAEIERELSQMMLFYAEQVAALQGFSNATPLVKNTAAYIRAHLTEKLTVNDIAEVLKQNPSYLSHHFKEQTGESISSYIVREKIGEAQRLLKGSDKSLLDISAALGFSSQQYFQSVFKKEVGCTPTEYRKRKE